MISCILFTPLYILSSNVYCILTLPVHYVEQGTNFICLWTLPFCLIVSGIWNSSGYSESALGCQGNRIQQWSCPCYIKVTSAFALLIKSNQQHFPLCFRMKVVYEHINILVFNSKVQFDSVNWYLHKQFWLTFYALYKGWGQGIMLLVLNSDLINWLKQKGQIV